MPGLFDQRLETKRALLPGVLASLGYWSHPSGPPADELVGPLHAKFGSGWPPQYLCLSADFAEGEGVPELRWKLRHSSLQKD